MSATFSVAAAARDTHGAATAREAVVKNRRRENGAGELESGTPHQRQSRPACFDFDQRERFQITQHSGGAAVRFTGRRC